MPLFAVCSASSTVFRDLNFSYDNFPYPGSRRYSEDETDRSAHSGSAEVVIKPITAHFMYTTYWPMCQMGGSLTPIPYWGALHKFPTDPLGLLGPLGTIWQMDSMKLSVSLLLRRFRSARIDPSRLPSTAGAGIKKSCRRKNSNLNNWSEKDQKRLTRA